MVVIPAAGCVRLPPPIVPPPEAVWRGELVGRWESLRGLRAEARISLTSGEEVYPGRMALVFLKPGRIRADFLDPFGGTKGLVIINGGSMLEYLPGTGRPGRRPPELEFIESLGDDGHPAAERLAALLTGLPDQTERKASYRWNDGAAGTGDDPPDVTTWYLTLAEGRTVPRKVFIPGRTPEECISITYEEYASIGGVLLPRVVTIDAPARRWSLTVTYKEVEVNVELDEALFSTEPHGS
jgi:outer membrane lipoprotein-sorting protein